MRFRFLRAFVLTASATAIVAFGGNGTFDNGEFNFCVSVRFNATQAQLDRIKARFTSASQIVADMTDGQHKFGTVTIVNDSGASQTAEFWIHAGQGGANAPLDGYGVRGKHVNMFYDRHFLPNGAEAATERVYTIAHEFAHLAYGVRDEYKGPAGAAECAPAPGVATLNFCIMDNYKSRGGQMAGGTVHTLNELCVAGNHDPDTDTNQHLTHAKSCWEVIDAHAKRSANAPANLPTSAAPAAHAVTTVEGSAGIRAMLVLDRSGSMTTGQRLDFAKSGAKLFVDVFEQGDFLGVASFSSTASVDYSLTQINGAAERTAAKAAVDSLVATGTTNIGGGLLAGLGQITAQTTRSCNEIIVLLSDGDHNTGTDPASVIPQLQDENVTVFAVGVGSGISVGGQATLQNLATSTGGRYFAVASAADLPKLFLLLQNETTGSGLLEDEPGQMGPNEVLETTVLVETGAVSGQFAMTLTNDADDIVLSLRDPGGTIVDQTSAMTDPDVDYLQGPNYRLFEVRSPVPGDWVVVATSGSVVNNGALGLLAFAQNDGVQLVVSVRNETLSYPEAVEVEATLTFGGRNVFGAAVSGVVVRPDGSSYPISLFDDGLLSSADAVANDGVYSAVFDNYSLNGTYTFDVRADAPLGMIYPGEEIDVLPGDPILPAPPFVRCGVASAVLMGIPVDVPLGENYCPNNPNSSGQAGTVEATGSEVVAVNSFFLTASNLPTDVFGYFLVNEISGFVDLPAAGLSRGFLCLGGGGTLGRFNALVQDSGPTGTFTIPVDLTMIPNASETTPTVVQPGDTFYFQAWFRDPVAGAPENNFTDAVGVLFL
ncbi:MAG: VWA domain-containing protein [bacterium]|nr:VWA domain-containing protein [bacterium]